jgi:3-deoxy-7-phosphoheptulonate synthase
LQKHGLSTGIMIDCSHANSGKDPERQPAIAADLAQQISDGDRSICGAMIESNLLGGTQDQQAIPLVYGRSITDGCLAWEKTQPVLSTLAQAVRRRRGSLLV